MQHSLPALFHNMALADHTVRLGKVQHPMQQQLKRTW
jgi:hypothetical protein